MFAPLCPVRGKPAGVVLTEALARLLQHRRSATVESIGCSDRVRVASARP
jgi:hypothetical protein